MGGGGGGGGGGGQNLVVTPIYPLLIDKIGRFGSLPRSAPAICIWSLSIKIQKMCSCSWEQSLKRVIQGFRDQYACRNTV